MNNKDLKIAVNLVASSINDVSKNMLEKSKKIIEAIEKDENPDDATVAKGIQAETLISVAEAIQPVVKQLVVVTG